MSILNGIELPATSRFSIQENPNAAPGVCAVCRHSGGDGRLFVDFGLQLDWYGAVYFCSECIRELSEAVGFVPKMSLDIAQEISRNIAEEYDKLQKEFNDFRHSSSVVLRNCNCGLSGGIGGGIRSIVEDGEIIVAKYEPTIEDDRKPDKAGGK